MLHFNQILIMSDKDINTVDLSNLRDLFKDYVPKSAKRQQCRDDIGIMVYPNTGSVSGGKQVNITTVIEEIRSKSERLKVSDKKFLPAGYFSVAGFKGRKLDRNVIKHTGLIPIDIDKKDNQQTDLIELKRDLQRNKYTYACFNSPSGGIKLIINTNIDCNDHHDAYYYSIVKFLLAHYPVLTKIDTSGSNIARALYLPYDADAYFNPNAYKYFLNSKQVEEVICELKTVVLRNISSKVTLQVDSISFDEHYDNITKLIKNRTSKGLAMNKIHDENRTSVGIYESEKRTSMVMYDNIFNNYRYYNIGRGVMSTDVPFLELLILKNIYPHRLDYTTHLDEHYFKANTQEPISTTDIDSLDGLDYCEVVLPSGSTIREGFRHKTIASISMKLIFNNPFCHPTYIYKEVKRINDYYSEDSNPHGNPKPNDEEVMNIVMNNYTKFLSGELDFSVVIRKNDKNKKVSKKFVFKSRLYVDICASHTHSKAVRIYAKGKRDKNMKEYAEAIYTLQDGAKITKKRIAECMGMTTRNLRRYKTEEYDDIIKKYNALLKSSIQP